MFSKISGSIILFLIAQVCYIEQCNFFVKSSSIRGIQMLPEEALLYLKNECFWN
jgi:hypothetical protein